MKLAFVHGQHHGLSGLRALVQAAIKTLLISFLALSLSNGIALADSTLAKAATLSIVRLDQDKTAASIAEQYLGDKFDAWQISELNDRAMFKAGDIVALPLKPINPGAVYAKHYRSIPILCYHQFSAGSTAKSQMEVSGSAFDEQMAYLVNNNYEVVPLKKVADMLSGKTSIPPKAVVLTIDDGYRSVYDIAYPILKNYGLSATMFVYTDFIGGSAALSWKQIKEMQGSGVFDIESHTKTHGSLSYDASIEDINSHKTRVSNEIGLAEAAIKKHSGRSVSLLAYPYGDSSQGTLEYLKASSNYTLAATVKRGANSTFANPLLLQRTMLYNSHTLADFKTMITGTQAR